MKRRNFFLSLTLGVIAILAIAIVNLINILAKSPLKLLQGGITEEPTAAMFVSRQAPIMLSLQVNPDRLEAFTDLATPISQRKKSHGEYQEIKDSILSNTQINYARDIQPWLGEEATLAVTSLDFDRNYQNGVQPGYLCAISTKNKNLAKEFLQASFSQQAIVGELELEFENYKGVNLIYQNPLTPNQKSTLASAIVGNFILFANHPKVLKEAINNVQASDLSLQQSSDYQNALKTITNPRIGIAFINLPSLSAWIGKKPLPETPEIQQMLTLALALKSEGLVAQTALIGVSGETEQKPSLNAPVEALRYIPSNSILTAAGKDLNHLWEQIQTGLEPESPLQQLVQQTVNKLQQPFGINIPKQIFTWVDQEYSFAVVNHAKNQQLDWIFVIEKDGKETYIEQLDQIAQAKGLSVGQFPILNTKIIAWTELTTASNNDNYTQLDAKVYGVHTNVGKYEIFASSIESLAQALKGDENSLLISQKFQNAITALPLNNDGYFYLDWTNIKPLTQKFPLIRVIEFIGHPLLENLQSLTLSSQGSENGIRRGTVFFNFTLK
jgi:hypothetical protein